MTTADRFISVSQGKLLGVQDFRDRLVDYLRDQVADIHQTAFGLDGTFGGILNTITAFGADRVQVNGDHLMGDGAGHFLQTDSTLGGRDVGLAFENSAAVLYYVALRHADRPRGIQINPITGLPEYQELEETIGDLDDPNSVTDNGATITFRVDTVADAVGSGVVTHAGRRCYVWRKIPAAGALTEAIAIELCTVSFSGGQNLITTTGLLGQTAGLVSTTASDYSVLMLGPTISRADLSAQAGYAFIGTVTGVGGGGTPTVFSTTGQNDLGSGFAVDLNAITTLINGDLKIRVRAVPADNDDLQVDIQDAGGSTVFSIDEDGDTVIAGDLTVAGTATLANLSLANLTIAGNALLGDANADDHIFRGRVRHQYDSGGLQTGLDISGTTGEIAMGGAVVAGQRLKTYGAITLGDQAADITTIRSELLAQFVGDPVPRLRLTYSGANTYLALGVDTDFSSILRAAGQVRLQENILLGESLNGGIAGAATVPRIDFGTTNVLSIINTLLQWTNTTGTAIRVHEGSGGTFTVTYNAAWNTLLTPDQWQKDVTGVAALRFDLGSSGLTLWLRLPANDADWDDSGWDRTWTFDLNALAAAITGALALGADLLGSAANVSTARLSAQHAEANFAATSNIFTLLFASTSLVANRQGVRVYIATQGADGNNDAGLWIVLNAVYTQSTDLWAKDDSDKVALALRLNGWSPGALRSSSIDIYHRAAETTGTWNRTGWTRAAGYVGDDNTVSPGGPRFDIVDGVLRLLAPTTGHGGFAAPTSTMLANALYERMIPRARIVCETDGVGGVTILGGFGITSASVSGNTITVVTQQNIANAHFEGMVGFPAAASPASADQGQLQNQPFTNPGNTFEFAVWASGGVVVLSTAARRLAISFYGD